VSDRFLNQHMLSVGEESSGNVEVSIGGRCHRSGVDRRHEIIERFGGCRAEFAGDGAAPDRLHVVNRSELNRRSFRVQPCMITADMPNTNNANAQLLHWSPMQSTPQAFTGQRSKVFDTTLLLRPVGE